MITPRRSLSPHHAASWRHHPRDYDLSWHCLHGTMWRATLIFFIMYSLRGALAYPLLVLGLRHDDALVVCMEILHSEVIYP